MLRPEIGNLSGVTLLHSADTLDYGPAITEFEPGSGTLEKIHAFTEAERHTMDLARSHGATIIRAAEGEDYAVDPESPGVYWQNRSYFDAHRITRQLLAPHQHRIPHMTTYALGSDTQEMQAYDELAAGRPLVLAYKPLDGGHIKYLLEDAGQLDRFRDFTRGPAGEGVKLDNFELREFVATPTDRYTSYRIIVDSIGTVLAAGLYYSTTHSESSPRIIENDRFKDSRPGSLVRRIKEALETPKSKYYLKARDVRSNSACGGKVIALMGNNRKVLNDTERAVLEAHNVDPEHVSPPSEHVEVAQFIGRTVGPQVHLLVGVDFVGPRYSETNFAPSGGAFAACHMQGEGTRTERYIAMREHALTNIALKHTVTA